jgi:hypothetical protein
MRTVRTAVAVLLCAVLACDGNAAGGSALTGPRADRDGSATESSADAAGATEDGGMQSSPIDAGVAARDGGEAKASDDAAISRVDGGSLDAGATTVGDASEASAEPDAGPVRQGPVLYAGETRHSPITRDVAAGLLRVFSRRPAADRRNFMRIGDNLSHASPFFGCFDAKSSGTSLLGASAGAAATIDYFNQGDIQGASPFAYTVDMESFTPQSVLDASAGTSFLSAQLQIAHPAFALVSFGPLWHGGITTPSPDDYVLVDLLGPSLLAIADQLLAADVIPILHSIPSRSPVTQEAQNQRVPLVAAIARAVAQTRQMPFADVRLDTLSSRVVAQRERSPDRVGKFIWHGHMPFDTAPAVGSRPVEGDHQDATRLGDKLNAGGQRLPGVALAVRTRRAHAPPVPHAVHGNDSGASLRHRRRPARLPSAHTEINRSQPPARDSA